MDIRSATPKQTTVQDRIVGERIQALRKSKGLSQTALGAAVGVTYQQVQKYETGTNRVGAGRLQEIAHLLEVPVSAFFDEGNGIAGDVQTDVFAFLRTPGAIDLLRAFDAIEDDSWRRDILTFVRSMARIGREQGI